jgi:hypothetical protein
VRLGDKDKQMGGNPRPSRFAGRIESLLFCSAPTPAVVGVDAWTTPNRHKSKPEASCTQPADSPATPCRQHHHRRRSSVARHRLACRAAGCLACQQQHIAMVRTCVHAGIKTQSLVIFSSLLTCLPVACVFAAHLFFLDPLNSSRSHHHRTRRNTTSNA